MADNDLQRKKQSNAANSANQAGQKQNAGADKHLTDNDKAKKRARTLECLSNLTMLHKLQGALLGQMEREIR